MTSAGSTIRGVDGDRATGDLTRRSVLELIAVWDLNFAFFWLSRARYPDTFIFYKQTPEMSLLSPSPTGTRKAAKPPLVCGFVATKRPNRVGERAGNAQGAEAEPRQDLKCGAGGARRRPTTDRGPRSNGAAVVFPLVGGSTHTKQR
jgi:hypothetical protein